MSTAKRSSVQLQLIAGTGKGATAGRAGKGTSLQARRSRAWRLDAETREIGREGVAQARAILSQVSPPEPPGHRQAS